MKLARVAYGTDQFWCEVRPDDGTIIPLQGPMEHWGPVVARGALDEVPRGGPERSISDVEMLVPATGTARVVAVGATYAKHIAGLGLEMPEQPAGFLKPVSSLVPPGAPIAYPAITNALDWEVELVVIIGRRLAEVEDPMHAILGYSVGNDVSARDLQFGGSITGMDMFSAKALDATGSVGPWIVTRDEFGDGHVQLPLELAVDGAVKQAASTADMVWPLGEVLTYVNDRMRLLPGDLIFTGTPEGVGHETSTYLQPGQEMAATIERIGTLRNTVGGRRR